MIKIKRVYEPYDTSDGFRILVDRLWPRGLSKDKAKIDLWMKEIAPSEELRRSFAHDINRWEEFRDRYKEELKSKKDLIDRIKSLEEENKIITLLFSARDVNHNNAVVLKEYLEGL